MKTTFRFPGADYAFAELVTSEGSVGDNYRELCDVDERFLLKVGEVLSSGCAMTAIAPLNPVLLDEPEPQWGNDGANAPQWASQAPQEAQGYSPTPQAYNTPQYAPQAPQGGYQQPSNVPPGMQAPNCQQHARPAEYKGAGISKKTNRPYNAFWACAAGDNNCTRASNFPRL